MSIKVDTNLDCKGLACPMPIVKTKKAMKGLASGQVIEIEATDKGSTLDMQSWSTKSRASIYRNETRGRYINALCKKIPRT